jgi:hypothetical protein|tara:strand:+ start:302 stop:511 length:210 start_codon:yes stop_codon:yes gene_type:complete
MKVFTEVRKKMPPGEHISDFKVGRISVMIHKDKGKFIAYVDGDKLDAYNSQKEAEKTATQFVKEFGKMK